MREDVSRARPAAVHPSPFLDIPAMAATTPLTPSRPGRMLPSMSQAPRRAPGLVVIDDQQNRRDAQALQAARVLIDGGQFDDALALLTPLTENPSTSITAQATLLAAALHSMHSRPNEVLDLLARVDAARGVVVDRGFLLMLRSQALRQLGRTDEALACARECCSLGETPARLLVLADCAGTAHDVAGAIGALRRARTLDPHNLTVLAQLSGWLAKDGDRTGSDDVFAAFADEGFHDGCGEADTWRNAAFAHACRDDVDKAVAAIACAFAKDPVVTRGYVNDEPAFAAFRHTIPCVQADTD